MKRIYTKALLATLFIAAPLLSNITHSSSQLTIEKPRYLDEVDQIVEEALQAFNVPGASVSIISNGKTVFCKGYGVREAGSGLPVTERTLFPIASCTKAFTALIIGQLVDEGKLELDDPVIKHIPEFLLCSEKLTADVTIRDLLTHRTGFERHDAFWFLSNSSKDALFKSLQYFEPRWGLREKFVYNNIMYAVAGKVIEKVTGQTWEEAVASRILSPLQMTSSNTTIDEMLASQDYSIPYAYIDGKIQTIPFCICAPVNPAAGVNSNALELANWAALHLSDGEFLGQTIISSSSLKEQHTSQIDIGFPSQTIGNPRAGYGLGWFIGDYRGRNWINHGGNLSGFVSHISLLPSENFGIVILTNSGDEGSYFITSVSQQIIDRFLGIEDIDWAETAQKIRDFNKLALNKALQTFENLSQAAQPIETLSDFVGSYEHPAYGTLVVRVEDGHLTVDFHTTVPLYFKSEKVFTGQYRELLAFGIDPAVEFSFSRNDSGTINAVHVPFEKFYKAEPITFIKN